MKHSKKNKKKLEFRIKDWESMRADNAIFGGRVKMIHGNGYRKPGSENSRKH